MRKIHTKRKMTMNTIERIKMELERLREETPIGLTEHENGVEQGRMEIINAIYKILC